MNENSLEKIFGGFSEEEKQISLDNSFPYIFTKANFFILDGPKSYSKKDALGLPDDSFSKNDLMLINIGCKQIIKGVGLTMDKPLKNLGINGCHKLFQLFHYKFLDQKAYRNDDGSFLDEMTFEHIVNKKRVTYYNLVN